MRRLFTFLVLIAMAVALNLLIKRCSAKHETRLIAQKQEPDEDMARIIEVFQPDTTSDIRFGHSKPRTDETRISESSPPSIHVSPWPSEAPSSTTATP